MTDGKTTQLARACLAGCALAMAALLVLMRGPSLGALPAALPELLAEHLLVELFAVIIAVMIVAVSWHTFNLQQHGRANLLICGLLITASCDLVHALSYNGMPRLLAPSSTDRAIFFWLMGRSAEAATLGLIALGWRLPGSRNSALAAGMLGSALLIWIGSYRLDLFPITFVPGRGVTEFKAAYEIGLTGVNLGVSAVLWRQALRSQQARTYLLATSCFVMGIGELAFTSYVSPSEIQNIGGHVFKVAAYALLYWATFITSLRAPFDAVHASESRARESEARMRSLSDNLPHCAVFQLVREPGGSLRLLHASDATQRLNGLAVAQVLADPSLAYRQIHPDDVAGVQAAYRRSAKDMAVFDVQVRMRRTDGEQRWMHLVAAPRRGDDGRVYWDGIEIDVTERRRVDDRLREHEAALAAIVDTASDAIVSADEGGCIVLFNPAAGRIFGRSAVRQIGQSVDTLLLPQQRAAHAEARAAFAASQVVQRAMGTRRIQGLHADGSVLELEATISQATIGGRKILTAILCDVTERVRSERALMQYQLELTALAQRLMAQEKITTRRLAQALHDQLGQTLTAMRIDFVDDAIFNDPRQGARHARVDRLIDQAMREVRQVLVDLRPPLLDERGLVEALDNELRTRRAQGAGPELRLVVDPPAAAQRWPADVEYAAFMIAREALENALRHAQASHIRLTLGGGPGSLQLDISDDGKGVGAPDNLSRPGHLGMVGMRERALAIGAQFELRSPPAGGTGVHLAWEGELP